MQAVRVWDFMLCQRETLNWFQWKLKDISLKGNSRRWLPLWNLRDLEKGHLEMGACRQRVRILLMPRLTCNQPHAFGLSSCLHSVCSPPPLCQSVSQRICSAWRHLPNPAPSDTVRSDPACWTLPVPVHPIVGHFLLPWSLFPFICILCILRFKKPDSGGVEWRITWIFTLKATMHTYTCYIHLVARPADKHSKHWGNFSYIIALFYLFMLLLHIKEENERIDDMCI